MLFSSYTFLFVFLPAAVLGYYALALLGGRTPALTFLILASFAFYASWNAAYLALLLASIGFNYLIACRLTSDEPHRRRWLIGGIAANLALLGYYKYATFFLGIVAPGYTIEAILLPLGISFFTFQQIMFLTDLYKGGQRGFGLRYYAASVSFFPHLIAGPIVPYRELMPQFATSGRIEVPWEQIAPGLLLLALGLTKKVLLADPLSEPVARVFDAAAAGEPVSRVDAWGGALAYTFQLYFDFSGYTDMALGLGHLFGIRLPVNFLSPYKSRSIAEFWRRWHITLSNFLRDHLYIPLGGNRGSQARTARNLLITMGLGGLWHGAGWTFVVWGLMHGAYLVVNRAWSTGGRRLPAILAWALTFLAVVAGWVMFRAHSVESAVSLYGAMIFGAADGPRLVGRDTLGHIGVLALIAFFAPNTIEWVRGTASHPSRFRTSWAYAAAAIALLLVATLNLHRVSEFLYFNF